MRVRGIVTGHGKCSNADSRLHLVQTSSTEEEVGNLFGTRCPLSAVPNVAGVWPLQWRVPTCAGTRRRSRRKSRRTRTGQFPVGAARPGRERDLTRTGPAIGIGCG